MHFTPFCSITLISSLSLHLLLLCYLLPSSPCTLSTSLPSIVFACVSWIVYTHVCVCVCTVDAVAVMGNFLLNQTYSLYFISCKVALLLALLTLIARTRKMLICLSKHIHPPAGFCFFFFLCDLLRRGSVEHVACFSHWYTDTVAPGSCTLLLKTSSSAGAVGAKCFTQRLEDSVRAGMEGGMLPIARKFVL